MYRLGRASRTLRALPTGLPMMRRATAPLALALALPLAPGAARADDDGIYGRIRGDLVLSGEVLGGALSATDEVRPSLSVALRARYLDVVGLAAGYDVALRGPRYDALSLAVDFRPLFWVRVNYDLQQGPRWLDLFIDSIGLELGAAWLRPGEAYGAGAGLAMLLGAGFELPLAWSNGRGVLLRVAGRWFASEPWDAQGTGRDDTGYALSAGLVVRTITRSGLVGEH